MTTLTLHKCTDDENTINKTLDAGQEFTITLRRDFDISNPDINLVFAIGFDVHKFNYASIPDLGRFYFVRQITSLGGSIYRFNLECDVLETYKEDILNSNCRYNRKMRTGDYFDVGFDNLTTKTIDKVFSNKVGYTGKSTLIISTISG